MPKGDYLAEFEIYVMLAVMRLGDDAYGVTIRREIEERAGRPVSIGAVYATLGRLEEKAMVKFHTSNPEPVQGGRSKKLVLLTPDGRTALEHSTAMLRRMMEGTPVAQQG
jgi:DNA-binding PadR family transcriptional regulator